MKGGTLIAPPQTPKTLDVTVTMTQAFILSDMIALMDKESFKYKELKDLGWELHKKAKEIND